MVREEHLILLASLSKYVWVLRKSGRAAEMWISFNHAKKVCLQAKDKKAVA